MLYNIIIFIRSWIHSILFLLVFLSFQAIGQQQQLELEQLTSLVKEKECEQIAGILTEYNKRADKDANQWLDGVKQLVSCYYLTKNYKESAAWAKQAVSQESIIKSANPFTLERIFNYGGHALLFEGKYQEGINFVKQGIAVLEYRPDIVNTLELGKLYVLLGDIYYNIENMKRAEEAYNRAMPIYERFTDDQSVLLNYYYRLAALETHKKNHELSVVYNQKILDVLLSAEKKDPFFIASVYNSMANDYYRMRNFHKADEENLKAIEVLSLHDSKHRNLANYYNFQAATALSLKNYKEGISFANKGFSFKNPTTDNILSTNIIKLFINSGQLDSATYYCQKVINSEHLYKTTKMRAWRSLGNIQSHQGNFEQALGCYNHSFALADTLFKQLELEELPQISLNKINSDILETYISKVNTLYKSALTKPAHEQLEKLLAIKKAYAYLVELVNSELMTIKMSQSRAGFYGSILESNERYLMLLEKLTELDPENKQDYLSEVFGLMERFKAMELQHQKQAMESRVSLQIPDSVMVLQSTLKSKWLKFAQQNELNPEQTNWTDSILAVNGQLRKIERYLSENFSSYSKMDRFEQQLGLSDWQAKLQDNQLSISYFQGTSKVFALAASRKEAQFVALGSLDSLSALMQQFYEQISRPPVLLTSGQNVNEFQNLAYALYDQLLNPFREQLSPAITNILIFPDGQMSMIPFESFVKEKIQAEDFSTLAYLIKSYQFQYGYSANLMQTKTSAVVSDKRMLAFGYSEPSPNFWLAKANNAKESNTRDNLFSEIPGSGEEVSLLARLFKGKFFLNEEATETRFKQESSSFPIIHLAVHGKANLHSPYNSGLYFKNTTDSLNDGVLYAYELMDLPISAALVILSACETGVGKLLAGEGVYSMARAFYYAGNPSQIVSFWKANDRYTAGIMSSFYHNLLKKNLNHTQALGEAKIAYLTEADGLTSHPYYWAAFVPMGQSVVFSTNYAKWIFIGLLALLAFVALIVLIKRKRVGLPKDKVV